MRGVSGRVDERWAKLPVFVTGSPGCHLHDPSTFRLLVESKGGVFAEHIIRGIDYCTSGMDYKMIPHRIAYRYKLDYPVELRIHKSSPLQKKQVGYKKSAGMTEGVPENERVDDDMFKNEISSQVL